MDSQYYPTNINNQARAYYQLGNHIVAHQLYRLAAHLSWRFFKDREGQLRSLNKALGAIRPVTRLDYGGGLNTHNLLSSTLQEIGWTYSQPTTGSTDFIEQRRAFFGEMALIFNDYMFEKEPEYRDLAIACLTTYWDQKQILWKDPKESRDVTREVEECRALRRYIYIAYRTGYDYSEARSQIKTLEQQTKELNTIDKIQAHTNEDVLAGIYAAEYGYDKCETIALVDRFALTPDRPWVLASRTDHQARVIAAQASGSKSLREQGRHTMKEALYQYRRFGIVPEPPIPGQLSLEKACQKLGLPAPQDNRGSLTIANSGLKSILGIVRGEHQNFPKIQLPDAEETWPHRAFLGLDMYAPKASVT